MNNLDKVLENFEKNKDNLTIESIEDLSYLFHVELYEEFAKENPFFIKKFKRLVDIYFEDILKKNIKFDIKENMLISDFGKTKIMNTMELIDIFFQQSNNRYVFLFLSNRESNIILNCIFNVKSR